MKPLTRPTTTDSPLKLHGRAVSNYFNTVHAALAHQGGGIFTPAEITKTESRPS